MGKDMVNHAKLNIEKSFFICYNIFYTIIPKQPIQVIGRTGSKTVCRWILKGRGAIWIKDTCQKHSGNCNQWDL